MDWRQEPILSGMAVDELPGDDERAAGNASLRLPVSISIVAHIALLVLMIGLDVRLPEYSPEPQPSVVRISIVPPLTPVSTPEAQEVGETPETVAEDTGIVQTEFPDLPVVPDTLQAEPTLSQADADRADRIEVVPGPRLQVPSVVDLRNAVNTVNARQGDRAAMLDCDSIQQRNPLFECGEQDGPDFSVLDTTMVSEYFASDARIELPDTGEGFAGAEQTSRAIRMIDSANRTHTTRRRVMGY